MKSNWWRLVLCAAIVVPTVWWLIEIDTASISTPPPTAAGDTTNPPQDPAAKTAAKTVESLPPIEESALFISILNLEGKNSENQRWGIIVQDFGGGRVVAFLPDPSGEVSEEDAVKASLLAVDSNGDGNIDEVAQDGQITKRKGENEQEFQRCDRVFQRCVKEVHVERFRVGKK